MGAENSLPTLVGVLLAAGSDSRSDPNQDTGAINNRSDKGNCIFNEDFTNDDRINVLDLTVLKINCR